MSTISCRQCRMPVDAAAASCPHCGLPDPSGSAAASGGALRRRRRVYIALVIAAALFVAFCFTSDDAEGLTGARGPGAGGATVPHAPVELIVRHDAAAGVVAVYRADEAAPMLTPHAPPDQRPYLHPIVPADGRDACTGGSVRGRRRGASTGSRRRRSEGAGRLHDHSRRHGDPGAGGASMAPNQGRYCRPHSHPATT